MRTNHLGECVVLGQEAVTGMDRVTAGDECRGQQRRRGQVRAARLGRADAHCLVGKLDGARFAIRLAVRHDGGDAHLSTRALDAQCDLATVGDQDLAEHALPARLSFRFNARDQLAVLDRLT